MASHIFGRDTLSEHGGLSPEVWQILIEQPALSPPPGKVSNFHGHSTLFPWVMAIMGLQLGIALVAVPIRIFTYWRLHGRLSIEDFLIVLGSLLIIGEDIDVTYGGAHVYSQHMWNVTFGGFFKGLKMVYIVNVFYAVDILCVKLAILFQFLRLFAPRKQNNPSLWYGCWILIVCNSIFYLVILGVALGVCSPVEKFWNPLMKGHCLNLAAGYKATGIINSVSDFVILLLPLPTLIRLHLPLRTRVGIMCIFGIGAFAIVASVVRTYYIWLTFGPSADMTWNITIVGICFWAEFTMGILAFCLPIFPQFLHIVRDTMQTRLSTSRGSDDAAPGSDSDVEMHVQRAQAKTNTPRFMDVSLASFEIDDTSNYGSNFDPHQAVHALTHG